ncbi:MAG: ribulose-phosphate 3-epimerase [Thalassobius sp.]|nr:ribulose-phosphate 3-epimerase [Thalassovita sp.]
MCLMKTLIAPSLLASDFNNLSKEIEMINESEADWIHFDVMDGRFVPNISFGIPVCASINKIAKKPIDVHLMIVEPDKYVQAFKEAGASSISVHIEASPHLHRTIGLIKELGCKAGVAINPHTTVEQLENVLADIDFVNVMTVNPGFGGQKFIKQSLVKIKKLRAMANELNPNLGIEVDGGVDLTNIKEIKEAGANIFVAGSAVFKAENPAETISKMKLI